MPAGRPAALGSRGRRRRMTCPFRSRVRPRVCGESRSRCRLEAVKPDDSAAEVDGGEVGVRRLVMPGGDPAPCFELVDQAFDGVAVLVQVLIVGDRPSAAPSPLFWLAAWSFFSGMTALMPRSRRWARLAREEYALSPATASGRVRGRPARPRTRTLARTGTHWGLSAACPGVRVKASGRQRRSAATWTLLVSPPRERPRAAAFSRARRRRYRRRRSSRRAASATSPGSAGP